MTKTATTLETNKMRSTVRLLSVAVGTMLLGPAASFQHHPTTVRNTPTTSARHRLLHGRFRLTTLQTSLSTSDNDTSTASSSSASPPSLVEGLWKKSIETLTSTATSSFRNRPTVPTSPGAAFLEAVAKGDIDQAMAYVSDTVEFDDVEHPSPLDRRQLERNLRLQASLPLRPLTIERDVYDPASGKAGVVFRRQDRKCAAFFETDPPRRMITKAFYVQENQKQGAANLKILKLASDVIGKGSSSKRESKVVNSSQSTSSTTVSKRLASSSSTPSLPEQYFEAWNQRDINRATSLFSTMIEYDDTAFPEPFVGSDALKKHLCLCADALPEGFSFVLDDKIDVGDQVMVRWHVENNGEQMPFTNGCSFYEVEKGKIRRGTDWKEPAVFKTGGLNLFVATFLNNVKREPVRLLPLVVWITYCYVVFFSDWFFGVPVQALESRTWEEVRDLSLNFFLVAPILGLPFAPVVHPGLEAIFNLLLSWAAMFAGFLTDDRPQKPNPLPMLPTVIGMQFLTSAFLLPYLATRSTETQRNVTREDLTAVSRATESRLLGPAMGAVGAGSILWGFVARQQEFGGLQERLASLIDLLCIDRVGSSFLVDLAMFGLFQGWLVDDDLKRRGVDENCSDSVLYQAAKYVPFFGMAAYLTFRPPLPSQSE